MASSTCSDERDILEHEIDLRMRKISTHTEEIAKLSTEVVFLKSRMNAALPIAKLPAEVLAEILLTYQTRLFSRWGSAPYRWLHILHICSRWRQVALGCPRLWTTIDPAHPELVAAELKLSGRLPLIVQFRATPNRKDQLQLYKLVLPHFSRIRVASIRLTSDVKSLIDAQQASLEAPLLERLDISFVQGTAVPTGLATMSAPRLSDLCMKGGNFAALESVVRTTITSLELQYHPSHPSQLVKLLHSLPLLHHLVLQNVAQNPRELRTDLAGQLPPPTRTASLPQLVFLSMIEDHRSGESHAYLLDHLTFPKDVQIFFVARGPGDSVSGGLVCKSIKAKLHTKGSRPQTVYVDTDLKVKLYSLRMPLEELDSLYTDHLYQAHVGLYMSDSDHNETVAMKFLLDLDLTNVSTLAIHSPLTFASWYILLDKMTKLEELLVGTAAFNLQFLMFLMLRGHYCTEHTPFKVLYLLRPKMKKHPRRLDPRDPLPLLTLFLSLCALEDLPLDRLFFESPMNMTNKDFHMLKAIGGAKEVDIDEIQEESWTDCGSSCEEEDEERGAGEDDDGEGEDDEDDGEGDKNGGDGDENAHAGENEVGVEGEVADMD